MKNYLGLIFTLLIFSSPLFADAAPRRKATLGNNPLLRFVAEIRIFRELALTTLIENRCARYMKVEERGPCYQAVSQKIDVLDFDILLGKDKSTPVLLDKNNPGSFVFVAFKKDFIRLLSEQKTEIYLDLINGEMTKFLTGEKKFAPNLWEMTLAHYGSTFLAARALAILFQDTSHVKLHLAYLEMSGVQGTTSWFDSNRELLGRTIDTLNMVLDAHSENFQPMFYPSSVAAKLHRTIYHFYVPTYLAMALRRKGIAEKFSFIAPFMMTLTYEFVTAAPDYRYLLSDPNRLPRGDQNSEWKVGDIYGGYNGVSFATGRINRIHGVDYVSRAFDISTQLGVQALIK